jgi:16S rRNA (cytosine1402-N4)-methyltransferase
VPVDEFGSGHVPVLAREVAELFGPGAGRRLLDGTFGRGGHSALLIGQGWRVTALDRDDEALAWGEKLRAGRGWNEEQLDLRRMDFGDMSVMRQETGAFDGVLLDLGISSPQVDQPDRGFSFLQDGPLDMRMDRRQALTARVIVNTWTEEELTRCFREFGEVREARRVARAIFRAREKREITGTAELAALISDVLGGRRGRKIHPATQAFQALRIAVNDELGALDRALESIPSLLVGGGRLGIISFHTLEDRRVKRFIEEHSREENRGEGMAFGLPNPKFCLRRLGRWLPSDGEIAANPRARSARLRTAEKIGEAA